MDNARSDEIEQLEAGGFDTSNVEILEFARRARQAQPRATIAELEEYRRMLPMLRWLYQHQAAIKAFIEQERPAIRTMCPLYSRLSGDE